MRSLDPKGRATQTNFELGVVRAIAGSPGVPEPHLQFPVIDDVAHRLADLVLRLRRFFGG